MSRGSRFTWHGRWELTAVAVVLGIAPGLVAPAADASQVVESGDSITYTAGAGETNDLIVQELGAGTIRFNDSVGMTTTSVGACVYPFNSPPNIDLTVMDCLPANNLDLDIGDMNDTVVTATVTTKGSVALRSGADEIAFNGPGESYGVSGGDGADIVHWPALGSIVFDGQNDTDTCSFTSANDTVTLDGLVNDGPSGLDGCIAEIVDGGGGDDNLTGGPGANQLLGNSGADNLRGEGGGDVLDGQADTDTCVYGGMAAVKVTLDGLANDGISGGTEGDNCKAENVFTGIGGGPGADELIGDGGANQLLGGGGDDTLEGGGGADFLAGQLGSHDVCRYSGSAGVSVSLDGSANDGTAGGAEGDDCAAEDVASGSGPDVLSGDLGPNILSAGGGDDRLIGMGAADELLGQGNIDTCVYAGAAPVKVTVQDGLANDGTANGAEGDNCDGENAEGGSGADSLIGSAGPNRLVGNAGGDSIIGGAASDTVLPGSGPDAVQVRDGEVDTVDCAEGGAGDSILSDTAPADVLNDCGSALLDDDDLDFIGGPADRCPTIASPGTTDGCPRPETTLTQTAAARVKTKKKKKGRKRRRIVIPASFAIGSSEPGSSFACKLDGAPVACGTSLTLPGLAPGTHRLEAVATDPAGNADLTPAAVTFTVPKAKKQKKRRH